MVFKDVSKDVSVVGSGALAAGCEMNLRNFVFITV